MEKILKKGEREHISKTLLSGMNENYREILRLYNVLVTTSGVGDDTVGLSMRDQKKIIRQMVKEINKNLDNSRNLKSYIRLIARREKVEIDE